MATPSNQAAYLDGAGKITESKVAEAPYPTPGADEIIVKNHNLAINPVDWNIQDYGVFVQKWPTILGTDIAWKSLNHLTTLATGNTAGAAFQLYTAAPASTSLVLPSKISYNEGVVLPLAIDTAAVGLYSDKDQGFFGLPLPSLNPSSSGKTIIVWCGSSSVGASAIQLAVASGAKVVTVASQHNHAFVKSLGASEAVDYNNFSVVEDVVKAVQSVGGEFLGAYDAISTEASYKLVVPIVENLGRGSVATVLPPPENGPESSNYLGPALEQGKLKAVPEPQVVGKGLESVQKGFDANKAGVSAKKVVIELV